jgi:hypothetical protein
MHVDRDLRETMKIARKSPPAESGLGQKRLNVAAGWNVRSGRKQSYRASSAP